MKLIHTMSLFFRRNLILTILILILVVSLVSAIIVSFIEAQHNPELQSFGSAIYWVLVTITTVGYGDIVPVTGAGRFLGIIIIFAGVALVSTFTATVSSIFVAQKLKEERGLKQISEKNHIILCGWNHTAEQILNTIFKHPQSPAVVMIHQLSEDLVQNIMFKFKGKSLHFVRGDFVQEEILNRANLSKAKAVLIVPDQSTGLTARSDEKTILTAFSVKAIQPKLKVYAHILDHDNEPYLKKAQVDDYIVSDAFAGVFMGEMVTNPGVPQSLKHLIGDNSANRLLRVSVPESFVGKTFKEAFVHFRSRNQLPIGLITEQKPLSLSHVLTEDYTYLDEFIEKKFRQAGRSLKKGESINVQMNPPDDTVLQQDHFLIVIQ